MGPKPVGRGDAATRDALLLLLLLGLADCVMLDVGAGKTAEVEHLRHSVMVINSAVTTDESHKARK